ncbi:MAG: AI-2E family transporter [Nocardioides sp.]
MTDDGLRSPERRERSEQAEKPAREEVLGDGIVWLSRWTLRWLILALGFTLLTWLVAEVWSILLPIVLALVLTTVLEPPARWLQRRGHLGAPVAAAVMVLGFVGVLTLVVLFLAPSVGSQVGEIADNAAQGLGKLEDSFAKSDLATKDQVDAAVGALQDKLRSSASSIASGVLVGVSAATSVLINALLTLVLTFFFLKDGRYFLPWLKRQLGPSTGHHVGEVASRSWATLGGFVRTQAVVGLIDAVLIGTGLAIIGVPLALPLAVLTFVAAFAPIIGAIAIGAVAVLVALVSQGYVAALIVLALVLLVQQLEGNLLLPWLQGRTLHLHAGVVLLTIVLGSTLFGVAGAFLSVPAVAVAAVVLRYLNDLVCERSGKLVPDEDVPRSEPVEEPSA